MVEHPQPDVYPGDDDAAEPEPRDGSEPAGPPSRRRLVAWTVAAAVLLVALVAVRWSGVPAVPSLDRLAAGDDAGEAGADLEQLAFARRAARDRVEPADAPAAGTLAAPAPGEGFGGDLDARTRAGDDTGDDPSRRVEAPAPPPGMPRLMPGRRPADDPSAPSQSIVRVEGPPVEELWRRAETLRAEGRFHTLDRLLDRLLVAHPDHAEARRWRRRLPRWVAGQERRLRRDVERGLRELGRHASARDLEGVFALWGGRADEATRRFFRHLVERYDRLRVGARLDAFAVVDGSAHFAASVVLRGERQGAGGETAIEQRTWRGELRDGRFVGPFLD